MGQNNCVSAKSIGIEATKRQSDRSSLRRQKHPDLASGFTAILNEDGTVKYEVPGKNNTIIHNLVIYSEDKPQQTATRSESNLAFRMIRRGLESYYRVELKRDCGPLTQHNFVDMLFQELEKEGEPVEEHSLQLGDLLRKDIRATGRKRLLVQGEAGFGKSTLCTKLAQDWATNESSGFVHRFDLVIVYRLRDFAHQVEQVDSSGLVCLNLEEELVKFCLNHSTLLEKEVSGLDMNDEIIRQTVASLYSKSQDILIILDGYDEVPENKRYVIDDLVSTRKTRQQWLFGLSTIMVTSRPVNYPGHQNIYERVVSLVGVSNESIKTFVEGYFLDEPFKAQSLLELLKSRQLTILHSLSPFLIDLICQLHRFELLNEATVSQYNLLDMVVNLLAVRCVDKEGLNLTDDELETVLVNLGGFLYHLSDRLIVPLAALTDTFSGQDLELVTKCGLFTPRLRVTPTDIDATPLAETAECLHKLFVEFLLTKYLRTKLGEKDNDQDRCDYVGGVVNPPTPLYVISPTHKETVVLAGTLFPNIYFFWELQSEEGQPDILSGASFAMAEDVRSLVKLTRGVAPLSLEFQSETSIRNAHPLLPHSLVEKEALLYVLAHARPRPLALEFFFYRDNLVNMEEGSLALGLQCLEGPKVVWEATLTWSSNQPLNPELLELGSKLSERVLTDDVHYRLNWLSGCAWFNRTTSMEAWLEDVERSILNYNPEKAVLCNLGAGEIIYKSLPQLCQNRLGQWGGRLDVGRNEKAGDVFSCILGHDRTVTLMTSKGDHLGEEFTHEEYTANSSRLTKLMEFTLKKNKPLNLAFEINIRSREKI